MWASSQDVFVLGSDCKEMIMVQYGAMGYHVWTSEPQIWGSWVCCMGDALAEVVAKEGPRMLRLSASSPALLPSGSRFELAGLFSHARFRGVRRAGQLPRISAFSGLDRRLCHSAVSSMETDCSTLQKSEDRMACAVGEILCMPCLFAKWQTHRRLKPGVIQPVTIS